MRPLIVQVERGKGELVINKANKQEGKNISCWQAMDGQRETDVVLSFISNSKVENFIGDLGEIDGVQITLVPVGAMAMYPPENKVADQVTNVESKSPIEIFLAGLQSKGSWKGFLGYSVIGSIVVWIGLFTNTIYLLVAAMLIAPFAGPAMNSAIATARGDWSLLKKGLTRYFVAIVVTIVVCFLLSLILQQDVSTTMMVDRSKISSVVIILALTAGAAGALNLVQSERDSLVSGAAVGMLVAASLAPPTGVIGMALALGQWEMVKSGLFLLLLQLVGINLTGSIIFRLYGVNSTGARYNRGKNKVFFMSLVVTIVLAIGLAFWQFNSPLDLERSSTSKRAEAEIQKVVKGYENVGLVEATAKFTRADIPGKNILLCLVYVKPLEANTKENNTIKKELSNNILRTVNMKFTNVDPVVDLVIVDDGKMKTEN
jgi:uncharacterized hydrophobic protein (TIGR00341 family)